jgi:hypothetical protein
VQRQTPLRFVLVALAASAGACATSRWPDEPGKPVPASLAENVEAGDQFLNALTAARQQKGLSAPVTVPQYQDDLRAFASDLQAGKTSAPGVQRALQAWGDAKFHARVDSWLVDCSPGHPLEVPEALVNAETTIVVAYAAAHFHPNSASADQCAVLVAARRGS